MEMDDRASVLHSLDQHKNHIAALMISNAKSIASGVVAAPPASSSSNIGAAAASAYNDSSITGVKNHPNNSNNCNSNSNIINNSDALGSSRNSGRSIRSEDDDNDDNSKANNSGGEGSNSNSAMNTGRWSAAEHKRFLAGLDQFGTGNWKKITDMVGTRSCTQIRTHAQKYFIALQKPMNDPSNIENGGYARKKSKMLIGADHHLNSNIKTGSSAIITGYGGGGTPIHPSGIIPVTGTMGISGSGGGGGGNRNSNNRNNNSGSIINDKNKNNNGTIGGGGGGTGSGSGQMIKQFWGPDGLRDNNTGLTGMEVLAQAAITGEKNRLLSSSMDDAAALNAAANANNTVHNMGGGGIHGHGHYNQYESSLDKAVAELRKKIASEADAAAIATNGGGGHQQHQLNTNNTYSHAHAQPSVPSSSSEVLSEEAAAAASENVAAKRKLEDAHHNHVNHHHHAAAVVSSYEQQQQQQQQQQQHHHKKLKHSTSDYAAAVQDTLDRKEVLDKLQAVAERQEFLRLRQEVKNLNQTIIQLQQQSIESDNRVMEAITDRRAALNECKNLQEINSQLKTELRRMVLLFEHSGGQNNHNNSSALMAAATQGANVELLQARLTESELRYHTVTESLSRQTGVLTDQHRAILELNTQLEQERVKRQTLEFELTQVKKAPARLSRTYT